MLIAFARRVAPLRFKRWWRGLTAEKYLRIRAADLYNTYIRPRADMVLPLLRETGETHNFTYDLEPRSIGYLADMLAVAFRVPTKTVEAYIQEAISDHDLKAHILDGIGHATRNVQCVLGRRLGWYAAVRVLKPETVVETGVERGHGAVTLCAALLRNIDEGHPGRYFGTELRTEAGGLLTGRYATVGKVLYGDSIETLKNMDRPIDLFINDSDHSADYEYQEYLTIKPKLSPNGVILGDNAHVTDCLLRFSRENDRAFLFFREIPKGHWYQGASIGISVPPATRSP